MFDVVWGKGTYKNSSDVHRRNFPKGGFNTFGLNIVKSDTR